MIIGNLGHISDDLPWTHWEEKWSATEVKSKIETWLHTRKNIISEIISGCTQGWDMMFCEQALRLGIPIQVYLSYKDQHKNYYPEIQKRHFDIIEAADNIILFSKLYTDACIDNKNINLINNSDYITTYFIHHAKDEHIRKALKYARKTKKEYTNFYKISPNRVNYIRER